MLVLDIVGYLLLPYLYMIQCNRKIYGCNVAAGDAGEEFIHKLHQITTATISASTTKTGNVALGGNWELEVNISVTDVETFHETSLQRLQILFTIGWVDKSYQPCAKNIRADQ
jgi:hypothetical protein